MPGKSQKLSIDLTESAASTLIADSNEAVDYYKPAVEAELAKSGISEADFNQAIEKSKPAFFDGFHGSSYLFWGPRYVGAPKNSFNILIEFEYSEEWLPEGAEGTPSPQDSSEWQKTLTLLAPAMVHVAKGLRNISQKSGKHEPRCLFDFSSFYGGSLCVFLPIDQVDHCDEIADLLYKNGLQFPPSQHAQIEALNKIEWNYDPAVISSSILPNLARA